MKLLNVKLPKNVLEKISELAEGHLGSLSLLLIMCSEIINESKLVNEKKELATLEFLDLLKKSKIINEVLWDIYEHFYQFDDHAMICGDVGRVGLLLANEVQLKSMLESTLKQKYGELKI